MRRWWHNLSVSKKLYAVVGLMAVLIATELLTLLFAMRTLSSVRAFVEGEGLWSKAQKDAIHSLYQYALLGEEIHFSNFEAHLKIPMGDRIARLELQKVPSDKAIIRQGFLQGGNHPSDIDGMIELLQRFHKISYIEDAIAAWTQADERLDELTATARDIRKILLRPNQNPARVRSEIRLGLTRLAEINAELTKLESIFSASLGAGSRWLESLLMTALLLMVLTIESCGLLLTFFFSRNLNRSLKEMMTTANAVGQGNFSLRAPVHSSDELGQLAVSLNTMIEDLKTNIGERKLAESANQVKSMFLANMSHEIRTPLGVILGFIEVLKDPQLSATDRLRYLETIESTGQNLNRIINDILDISKVESGHLETEIREFSVKELLDELDTMFKRRVQQKQNQISFEIDPKSIDRIYSDRLRLQQILVNLIGNALRFTENGNVIVRYSSTPEVLSFEVSDTGIGLTPEQADKIFGLFTQADQSITRKYGGTGLGLVLSKRLAQILGGDVVLKQSTPGKGSTFLARVKNDRAMTTSRRSKEPPTKAGTDTAKDTEALRGKRVLVVDDSDENQLLLKVLLTKAGVDIDYAPNGAIGVEKAMSEDFDMVLMDIQMPVLDGYAATAKLRSLGYKKPIIALTANAMKEDRERSLQAGCNDYLTKPIHASTLLSSLVQNMDA